MQKKTKTVIRICVLIVALGIGSVCFWGSWHRNRIDRVFDGSRVKNPNGYLLDFSYMDEKLYRKLGQLTKEKAVWHSCEKEEKTMEIIIKNWRGLGWRFGP